MADTLQRLMDYNELRGFAPYNYSEAKADKALRRTGNFIQETEALYKMMTDGGKIGRGIEGKVRLSGKKKEIDPDEGQMNLLKKIIKKHIPGKKVWAYGSRVAGEAGERADLDLAVFDCSRCGGQGRRRRLQTAFIQKQGLFQDRLRSRRGKFCKL